MSWLVEGVVYTPDNIANVMSEGIRFGMYWIEQVRLTRSASFDGSVSWNDPRIYSQDFQITILSDDVVNTIDMGDVQYSLDFLSGIQSVILDEIVSNRTYPHHADVFLQLCTFGQVVYGI